MGLIDRIFGMVFGNGGNLIRDTAEVFVENAENGAMREARLRGDALAQFAGEFVQEKRGLFDRFMDALNRIPRPAMALGTLGLFTAAMVDPIWFAARMQGIALVPEPLWWLLGAIVSFYFGARHQLKNQQFQSQIAASLAMTPTVMRNLDALQNLEPEKASAEQTRIEPTVHRPVANTAAQYPENAALRDWARQ
ncbi:MAG: holin family protein [Planktotalea sp.]|uniref:holin family protein n=1 Tax=Planktotalea sp. TaxID=2029877 RepID=UPI003C72F198